MSYKLAFIFVCSILILSCNSTDKTPIHEIMVDGKKMTISYCLRKTYVSNYLYYQFQLAGSKPFEINSLDDENGLPYLDNIFKNAPIIYFDTTKRYCEILEHEAVFIKNSAYLDEPSNNYSDQEKIDIKKFIRQEILENIKTERQRFLIYIDPSEYSQTEFQSIGKAIQMDISIIDSLLFACQPFMGRRLAYDGWQLAGIVYGKLDDFCEVYSKSKEDYFKIFPDGRIAHYNELPAPGKNWLSSQNFIYSKIYMPGKVILLDNYTESDLLAYKNEKAESITENFSIQQGIKRE